MKNIEHFKFYSGLWLAHLFESFPNPVDIDVRWAEGKHYAGDRKFSTYHRVIVSWGKYSMDRETNPVEKEFWTAQATLTFLIKEEYIRSSTEEKNLNRDRFLFENCVLTEKGLTKLMSIGFIDKRNLGEKIMEYLKEGKYSALLRLVKFW
jgi:hypothetical protein